ncbi:MAG: hypothetical protein ABS81_12830 [Pseudonocardia sp. SCN 72-86]|nr:MAG: hypothetical protein ABS81_12830 [Pseudonocardia sp. SCN 72-86]
MSSTQDPRPAPTRLRAHLGWAAALAVVGLVAAGCSAGGGQAVTADVPTTAPAPPTPSRTYAAAQVQALVTFYAAADNDPPGSTDIAHPSDRHRTAGGTGTFDDPITMATDVREIPVGGVVYSPKLQRYFVMEDDCEPCIQEWGASKKAHVAFWIGGGTDARVAACEDALTSARPVAIEYDPPPGLPVDTRPLYAGGKCWPGT